MPLTQRLPFRASSGQPGIAGMSAGDAACSKSQVQLGSPFDRLKDGNPLATREAFGPSVSVQRRHWYTWRQNEYVS